MAEGNQKRKRGGLYCHECRAPIAPDDLVFSDYYGNPLCGKCTTTDGFSTLCPGCGRKVPNEFMVGSFCKDCAPEYD